MIPLIISTFILHNGCKTNPTTSEKTPDPTSQQTKSLTEKPEPGSTLKIKSKLSIEPSTMVGSIDSDNDGNWELLRVHDGQIFWHDKVITVSAKPQAVAQGEHNGKPALYVGFGQGKKYPTAPVQIWRITQEGVEQVYSNQQTRNIISDLHYREGRLFLAVAQDDGSIGSGWIENGAFTIVHKQKLALRQLPLSKEEIAIGRVYGDTPKSDGDLHIVNHLSGKKRRVDTFRGIRAIQKGDINQDGISDLLVSDGWHFKYGEAARARVRLHLGPDYTDVLTLGDFPKDYTVNRIETWTTSNGKALVLATGSRHAHLMQLTDIGWKSIEICTLPEGGNAIFSKIDETLFVFCSGKQTQKVALKWIVQNDKKESSQ